MPGLPPSRPSDERSGMCLTRFQRCDSLSRKPSPESFSDVRAVEQGNVIHDTVRLGGDHAHAFYANRIPNGDTVPRSPTGSLHLPLPLIPVFTAVSTGGVLVPHAAGGLIVTKAVGGYVAGTHLTATTTSAIKATAATVLAGNVAPNVIGGAGVFGTSIGAKGITGVLMSMGIMSSTPVWVPVALGCAALGYGYGSYRFVSHYMDYCMTTPTHKAARPEHQTVGVKRSAPRSRQKPMRLVDEVIAEFMSFFSKR